MLHLPGLAEGLQGGCYLRPLLLRYLRLPNLQEDQLRADRLPLLPLQNHHHLQGLQGKRASRPHLVNSPADQRL